MKFFKKSKEQSKQNSVDKILLGAVIGAAIGSVVGVSLAPKSGKETRKDLANQFDKIKKVSDNQAKSLLRRFRIYLRERNARKEKK